MNERGSHYRQPDPHGLRESYINRHMFVPMVTTMGVELTREAAKVVTIGHEVSGLENVIYQNGGDFSLSFFAGAVSFAALAKVRNIALRQGISAAVSLASTVIVETVGFPGPFGTADIKDIPAGVLGMIAWYGVNRMLVNNAGKIYPDDAK